MLKNIAPCVGPDLLKALCEMGHGDEIILADAHFPGHSMGIPVLRADGVKITTLLDGILPLLELDAHSQPLAMMAAVEGDTLDPEVEAAYLVAIRRHAVGIAPPERVERFAFYERAQKAFAVVLSGDTAKYGNIILKKGVTPPSPLNE